MEKRPSSLHGETKERVRLAGGKKRTSSVFQSRLGSGDSASSHHFIERGKTPLTDTKTFLRTVNSSNSEQIRCTNNPLHGARAVKNWEMHRTPTWERKTEPYFNELSCCQNVWYALATGSSGIAGSTMCRYMHANRHIRTQICIRAHTHARQETEEKLPQR